MLQVLYNKLLRPYLPRRLTVLNGVVTKYQRVLDRQTVISDYEDELITAVRRMVRRGDSVAVVGGGFGVSGTVAARCTGGDGRVTVYEASYKMLDVCRNTFRLNCVSDRVSLVPSVVGSPIDVWGDQVSQTLDPGDLPDVDVLVLDCEGSESSVIKALDIEPRVMIVEVHGYLGVDRFEVLGLLSHHGYGLVSAEMHNGELGVVVLTCKREVTE